MSEVKATLSKLFGAPALPKDSATWMDGIDANIQRAAERVVRWAIASGVQFSGPEKSNFISDLSNDLGHLFSETALNGMSPTDQSAFKAMISRRANVPLGPMQVGGLNDDFTKALVAFNAKYQVPADFV